MPKVQILRMGGQNYLNYNWLDYVNDSGYTDGTETASNPINIIPSNIITMTNVSEPIIGTDNFGNTQLMTPGNNYVFEGDYVVEQPFKNWLNNYNG